MCRRMAGQYIALGSDVIFVTVPTDHVHGPIHVEIGNQRRRALPVRGSAVPLTRRQRPVTRSALPMTRRQRPVTRNALPVTRREVPVAGTELKVRQRAGKPRHIGGAQPKFVAADVNPLIIPVGRSLSRLTPAATHSEWEVLSADFADFQINGSREGRERGEVRRTGNVVDWNGRLEKSGGGPPQSKTWRKFGAARRTRSVLECASPLALWNTVAGRVAHARSWAMMEIGLVVMLKSGIQKIDRFLQRQRASRSKIYSFKT